MGLDWRGFFHQHLRLLALVVAIKRLRTTAGGAIATFCVARAIYLDRPPFDLTRPNVWMASGLALILAGLGLRLAAHGYLQKKEALTTSGAYALCRHPLYLGSILMAYGFCFLFRDPYGFIIASAYFLAFYPLTIAWEEIRLAERYGAAHRAYCRETPLLLPLGHFRARGFRYGRALYSGGAVLLGTTALLLALVEVLARTMRAH
jgi:protein-S-isoprenylcysteine O-methyltransferase Ste14